MNHRAELELLAPAGDAECMRAAVANGANAVYFGLQQFNARHRAANFTLDELPATMAYLHAHEVRGFVTLNTLIFSDELGQINAFLDAIQSAGVDAVIVQDLGIARLIRQAAPGLAIHASTQMTLSEPRGVRFAVDELGVERVVVARELSIGDIKAIRDAVNVPIEAFVHGALCVAYSGQCLTSEALGGRSANRGQCAQACRLPYQLVVDGETRDLGDKAYLLSPQDLAGHELVADMAAAGVVSFKIEGRLKTPHYVAAATQTYRAAIDAALRGEKFRIPQEQERELAQTFSRGFTPGFLDGVNHQRLVAGRFPKSRGVLLGTLVSQRNRWFVIDAAVPFAIGDGIVFDLSRPQEQEPGGRIRELYRVSGGSGNRYEFALENPFAPDVRIPQGVRIWKTDDPALRKRLEQSWSRDRITHRVPLSVRASGKVGGAFQVSATDNDGHAVEAIWPGPLESARKHPLDESAFRAQFERLGDTPFDLAELKLDITEPILLPKSVLNDLRRQIVQQLVDARNAATKARPFYTDALAKWQASIPHRQAAAMPGYAVLVRSLEQLETLLAWQPEVGVAKPDWVYCDFEDPRRYAAAVERANASGIAIALATFRILKPGEEGFLKMIASAKPDGVLIRNLGGLDFFKREAPGLTLIGDFSLNVVNELTADLLIESGCARLTPGHDLNWEQLTSMVKRSPAAWFEPIVHHHMSMFHMEHCVFAALLSDGKDFRDCGRPCDKHRLDLRDRVGSAFPVIPDAGCRNTVYNAMPQSAAEYISGMRELGLVRFRVELLREEGEAVVELVSRYARVFAGRDDGRSLWKSLRGNNQFGLTRGTLQLV